MGLNFTNERVHALAREAASRTGQTQTKVIEMALERLLAELDKPGPEVMRAKVDAILAAVDAEMTDETRAALLADDLYDENGLPA